MRPSACMIYQSTLHGTAQPLLLLLLLMSSSNVSYTYTPRHMLSILPTDIYSIPNMHRR
jgi:hypothetical protein